MVKVWEDVGESGDVEEVEKCGGGWGVWGKDGLWERTQYETRISVRPVCVCVWGGGGVFTEGGGGYLVFPKQQNRQEQHRGQDHYCALPPTPDMTHYRFASN